MILLWLIVVLLAGGVFAWLAARTNPLLCRWISLAAISVDFVLVLGLGVRNFKASGIQVSVTGTNNWFEQVDWSWIPQFGIHFHLAMDGLSLLLVLLTMFLGIASVLASWTEITTGVGFFHFNCAVDSRGNHRRLSRARSFPFLFCLGAHAGPDVFSDRDLGP